MLQPLEAQFNIQFWTWGWRDRGTSRSYWPGPPTIHGPLTTEHPGPAARGEHLRVVTFVTQLLLPQVWKEDLSPLENYSQVPKNTSTPDQWWSFPFSVIAGWLLAQDSRRETQRGVSLLTSLITDTSFNNGKIWLSCSSVLLSFFITLQHFYPSLLTPLTFITMCNITMLIFYRKSLRSFIKIISIPPLIQQRQVIRVKINSSEISKW